MPYRVSAIATVRHIYHGSDQRGMQFPKGGSESAEFTFL
jgi:hypothetical protein